MRSFLRCLYAAFLLGLPLATVEGLPEKSLTDALDQAKSESKCLYVAFLGEDWSVSSDRFAKTVLNAPTFQEFAGTELIYFPVKARRKPPLNKSETARLQALVIHFNIKSYPTLIVLAPDGQEILRHGYKDIGPEAYVELLRKILPLSSP